MKIPAYNVLIVSLLMSVSQMAIADSEHNLNGFEHWQMNMIYQPGKSMLEREARGFVYIYDGFTDVQVSQVMDDKFERIDRMMFIGVKITDEVGEVETDPETGYAMIEEDGC